MPLDPRAQAFLDSLSALGSWADPRSISIDKQRKWMEKFARAQMGAAPAVSRVQDRSIPGPDGQVPIRVYTPEGRQPLPVLVYFHGGAFTMGSINTEDPVCRGLANGSGCIVVSVEYRLAPELTFQLLMYPVTSCACDTVSYRECGKGYMLTKEAMLWNWSLYVRDEAEGRHPYASPLQADDLSGLPPALVITAEYDPLRDEGEAYALRMLQAGVAAAYRRFDGLLHGGLPPETAREPYRHAVAALRRAFNRQSGGEILPGQDCP